MTTTRKFDAGKQHHRVSQREVLQVIKNATLSGVLLTMPDLHALVGTPAGDRSAMARIRAKVSKLAQLNHITCLQRPGSTRLHNYLTWVSDMAPPKPRHFAAKAAAKADLFKLEGNPNHYSDGLPRVRDVFAYGQGRTVELRA